jgi:hypothetical protein
MEGIEECKWAMRCNQSRRCIRVWQGIICHQEDR